jgi:hypothetical protein
MAHNVVLTRDFAYSQQLADKFLSFRDTQRFTDCKIRIQTCNQGSGQDTGNVIDCHANVLCAFSPVIDRMLESAMIEGQTKILEFPDIAPGILRQVVDYIYTGNITMAEEDVMEVVRVCDFLQMLEPRDRYVQEVLKMVAPRNVIGWMRLASSLSLDSVMMQCLDMISKSFQEVTSAEEFLELNLEELEYFLQDCCCSEDISSDDKLGAVFAWLSVVPENRVSEKSLEYVEMYINNSSKSMLSRLCGKYQKLIASDERLEANVERVLKRKDKSGFQAAISAMLSLVVIGGSYNQIGWYLGESELEEFTAIPDDIFSSGLSVCRYHGVGLVVTGGLQKKVCVVFNVLTKSWTNWQPMRQTRHNHVSACIQEELFVIGGKMRSAWERMIWTPSVETLTLDVEDATWQTAPPMPVAPQLPKVAHSGRGIYVMGEHSSRLYHFDVHSRSWSEKPALFSDPGAGFSLAYGDGKLFAVGERFAGVFCTTEESWSSIAQPEKVHNFGAAVIRGGALLLVGGDNADAEEFNAQEDRWEMASFKLPKPLRNHFIIDMSGSESDSM